MKFDWKQTGLVFLTLPFVAMGEVEVQSSRAVTNPPEITAKFIHESNPEQGVLQVEITDKEGVKSVSAMVERRRRGSVQVTAWDSWSAMKLTDTDVYEVSHPGEVEPLEVVVFVWMESAGHRYSFTPGSAEPKTVETKSLADWEALNKPKAALDQLGKIASPLEPFRYPLQAHRGRLGQGPQYSYGGVYLYDPQAQKLADELALAVQHSDTRRSFSQRATGMRAYTSGRAVYVLAVAGVGDQKALESLLREAKARNITVRGYARAEVTGGGVVWAALP
jgi:hypothetical protein